MTRLRDIWDTLGRCGLLFTKAALVLDLIRYLASSPNWPAEFREQHAPSEHSIREEMMELLDDLDGKWVEAWVALFRADPEEGLKYWRQKGETELIGRWWTSRKSTESAESGS